MALNEKTKKILNIVKAVLIWTVLAVSVFMMIFTLVSVNTFDRTDRNLFGYKFFIVQSDSMKATDFAAGDVIIVREVAMSKLKAGDIITFISQNPDSQGQTLTHKIREVTTDADGNLAFRTYGTTTNENDKSLATMVIGQYQAKIPKLGYFFAFLRTVPGYIVCILVPFILLILSQGINCIRLFRQYRSQQLAEITEQREKLEEEREQTLKMMEELKSLREQLVGKEEKEEKESSEKNEN